MPDRQRFERLLGFGTVPDLRVQRVQAESSACGRLVPLVGIGQTAHRLRGLQADPGGHQVEHPIQHLDSQRFGKVGMADQPCRAHQPEVCGCEPLDLETQRCRGVLLAKTDAGARQVLPHRAQRWRLVQARRKGLPQSCVGVAGQQDPGPRPGVWPAQMDFVNRLVREEGAFLVAASGGQRTGRRDEGPQVAVASQRHEKRRLPVVAFDAVPGLVVLNDKGACHRVGFHRPAQRGACQTRTWSTSMVTGKMPSSMLPPRVPPMATLSNRYWGALKGQAARPVPGLV